jgi:hypothetical protein
MMQYDTDNHAKAIIQQIPTPILVPRNLSADDLKKNSLKKCWHWMSHMWQYFCPGTGDGDNNGPCICCSERSCFVLSDDDHLVDVSPVASQRQNLMNDVRSLAGILLHFYLNPVVREFSRNYFADFTSIPL